MAKYLFYRIITASTEKQVQYFAALAEYDGKSIEALSTILFKGLINNALDYKEKNENLRTYLEQNIFLLLPPK